MSVRWLRCALRGPIASGVRGSSSMRAANSIFQAGWTLRGKRLLPHPKTTTKKESKHETEDTRGGRSRDGRACRFCGQQSAAGHQLGETGSLVRQLHGRQGLCGRKQHSDGRLLGESGLLAVREAGGRLQEGRVHGLDGGAAACDGLRLRGHHGRHEGLQGVRQERQGISFRRRLLEGQHGGRGRAGAVHGPFGQVRPRHDVQPGALGAVRGRGGQHSRGLEADARRAGAGARTAGRHPRGRRVPRARRGRFAAGGDCGRDGVCRGSAGADERE